MNNKARKQRLWKTKFRKNYQQRIHETVESECGLPADCLCVFIAKMAEVLSDRKLESRYGILVINDQGKDEPPLVTAHCWNVLDGQTFDLSPWADCPHHVEYVTEGDGDKFSFYRDQVIAFGIAPDEHLEADIARLMKAFHAHDVALAE